MSICHSGGGQVCIHTLTYIYIYKPQTCGLEESFGTFASEARFMANMNRGVDPDHALLGSKMIMCRCYLCCMKRNRGCRRAPSLKADNSDRIQTLTGAGRRAAGDARSGCRGCVAQGSFRVQSLRFNVLG